MSKKESKYDKFCKWTEENPIKAMILVQIPLCTITSCLTTLLIMSLK